MFSARGVLARLVAGAAFVSLCGSGADADGFARGDDTLLYFSGIDLWRHGGFSYGGILWSPAGLDRGGNALHLRRLGAHEGGAKRCKGKDSHESL